jgi:hypothetical protein
MKKIIILGISATIIIGIAVLIIALLGKTEPTLENNTLPEFDWINSGPFFINKEKYKIAENIAISIRGLKSNDVGTIFFISPEGKIVNRIGFDGQQKNGFNTYWKPNTSKNTGLHEVKQLVGTWTMVFNGTNYAPLHFEILNEYVPGGEAEVMDVPNPQSKPVSPQESLEPPLNDTS